MAMEHTLLIGNSVNQLTTNAVSWDAVLGKIRTNAGVPNLTQNQKPFSLYFEEIKNHWLISSRNGLDSFRRMVANQMQSMKPNVFHKRLVALPAKHILTTNYDYCLEDATGGKRQPANFDTDESKYSLFRRIKCAGKDFWHIHGELDHPSTIMLGHDHYVESCAQFRRYTTYEDGVFYKSVGKLRRRFKEPTVRLNDGKPFSWIDVFMLTHVHVIGFSMDFCETDLWYLISYKNRLRRREAANCPRLADSTIHFYGFQEPKKTERFQDTKSILDSFGVECHPYEVKKNDFKSAWKKVLADVKKRIK